MDRLFFPGVTLLILFNVSLSPELRGQSDDFKFLNHLNTIKSYSEGITYIELLKDQDVSSIGPDTLNFYLGKFNYYLADKASSIQAFQRVRDSSPYNREARLLSSFQLAYIGELGDARKALSNDRDIENQFLYAGAYLLGRDHTNFQRYADRFTFADRNFGPSEKNLVELNNSILAYRYKSPWVAGLMSAVVPGSGKFYAGKIGQGFTSILIHTIFGLQAWEGYRKDGLNSPRFIIFSSLFTGVYISNIVGSVFSIKIRRDEFNEQINESILLSMHVPLRLLFD